MSSTLKIHANRENAKSSTGPKTPEGKAASSRNSTTHGLSHGFVVLPHEDAAAFADLTDELAREFEPQSPHAQFLLRQMAESRWRLDRVRRYESIALEQLIAGVDESNPESLLVANLSNKVNNIFELLRRYANDAARAYFKAHAELLKAAAQHKAKLEEQAAQRRQERREQDEQDRYNAIYRNTFATPDSWKRENQPRPDAPDAENRV